MSAERQQPSVQSHVAMNGAAVPVVCQDLALRARNKLAQHFHFHRRAETFDFLKLGDTLVVRGQVPSFYLKQMVQTVLRDLEGVSWIDNQVEVISSDGLSSTRGQ